MSNLSYLSLCTEFYDLTKPEAGPKEVAFYESLVRAAKGPVLEAMCGSGRLLIPLLKKGLVVDGVDNSRHMLESCQKRCKEQGLDVNLFQQSLQNLSLPQKYDLIFIAIGSFQLIHDRKEALHILEKLSQALLPGGRLVLETFVPWDAIRDNIQGSILLNQSKEVITERTAHFPDHFEILNKSINTFDFKEQLEKSKTRYEKWVQGICVHAEEEEYIVRWYYAYEMELFLEKAGLPSVTTLDASFEQNEQATVFIAKSR